MNEAGGEGCVDFVEELEKDHAEPVADREYACLLYADPTTHRDTVVWQKAHAFVLEVIG